MKPPRAFAAAALLAGLAAAVSGAPGSGAHLGPVSPADWKPPVQLPPGAEYALLREDPLSHGIHALVRFPAGYEVREHTHAAAEVIVVVNGSLEVALNGDKETLKPGEVAVIPAGTPHSLRAPGLWRKTLFVTTTDGPYDLTYTEKEPEPSE